MNKKFTELLENYLKDYLADECRAAYSYEYWWNDKLDRCEVKVNSHDNEDIKHLCFKYDEKEELLLIQNGEEYWYILN